MNERILKCPESGPKTIKAIAEETGFDEASVRSKVYLMFYVKNPNGLGGNIDNPNCPIKLLPDGKLSVVGGGVHSTEEPTPVAAATTISDSDPS